MKRDVRTLHRWESEEGLPIHRHLHKKRGSVYAYRSELEAWWKERHAHLDKQDGETRARWSWTTISLVSTFSLLIFGASAYLFWQRTGVGVKGPKGRVMLAVLPFENLNGDPDQDYFGDGLTEEMIVRLGGLNPQQLAVIARSSAMRYKHSNAGATQIGQELGVDYLLQGTVRRDGSNVRVSAELVQVSNQTQLWAHTYQHDLRDVLTLQTDLAQAVASEIQVKLTRLQQKRLAMAHVSPPEAHEAYLKGLFFWNKYTEQGMRQAIEDFQQAINLDPSYAEAYAMLGSCYGILGNFSVIPPNESLPRNKAAALKALEIDDTVSEAHTQLGFSTMFYDHDWTRAETEFRRAIELNPSNSNAHRGLAQLLLSTGHFEESLAEIERARQLDPVSLSINSDRGWDLYFARKPDEAIAQLQKTLALDPNFAVAHSMLGNTYEFIGEFDKAIAEYQAAITLGGNLTMRLAYIGHAYAAAGKQREARRVLARLQELSHQTYVPPYPVALVHTALGQKDDAFVWLERACDDHYWMVAFFKVDPRLDPLRSDPRFQNLLSRVGLDQ